MRWIVGLNLSFRLQYDKEQRTLIRARNGMVRARIALAERRQSIRIE